MKPDSLELLGRQRRQWEWSLGHSVESASSLSPTPESDGSRRCMDVSGQIFLVLVNLS